MIVYHTDGAVRWTGAARLAATFGVELRSLAAVDLAAVQDAFRMALQTGRAVALIDYLVESERDWATVTQFLDSVRARVGKHYYAPRPNSYVWVPAPAMIALNPGARPGWTTQAGQLLHKVRRLWQKPTGADDMPGVTRAPDQVAEVRPGPQVVLPPLVQQFEGDWTEFIPGEEALLHDLVERGHLYFPHPKGIHVILLNKCNLACVMCPYHSPVYREHHKSGYFDPYRSMQPELFERIADYAAQHGIALQFGQIEEALMHKGFLDFIELAHRKGVPHMHLTTNGTLLTSDKAERLAASGITSVMFSVDSVDAGTYKEIRGADLKDLEAKIAYFLPKAKDAGIQVSVSFVLQPQSRSQKDVFLAKWRDLGVDRVTFYVLTEHDKETGESIRNEDFYERADRYPCASPWIQSVIFPEGEVSLCCKTMTDVGWRGIVSVGNAAREDLDDIWSGENYRKVRRELIHNVFEKFDVCTNCQIWSASTSNTEEKDDYILYYNETAKTYHFKRNDP